MNEKDIPSSIDIVFVINFHALYNQYNKKLVVCGPAFKFETNIDITADEEYTISVRSLIPRRNRREIQKHA